MYKESIFNIKFSHRGKDYIYNTANSGLIEIEKPITELINTEFREFLLQENYIVPYYENEIENLYNRVEKTINEKLNKLELTILLTEKCNFQCKYCYQEHNPSTLSIDDAKKILKEIEKSCDQYLKALSIHYFGGEPLLNIEVLRYLDKELKALCNEYNLLYESYLTTNASLITEQILKEFKFNTIQITFDGYKQIHDNLRISDTFNYRNLINTFHKILIYSESRIKIRFNICKENADSFFYVIDDIFNISDFDLKRVTFQLNPMRNFNNSKVFTELDALEYSKINFKLRMYLQQKGVSLSLPRPISQPCKFTTGNAFCIGPRLNKYFCSSSLANGNYNGVSNIFDKKKVKFTLPDVCNKCKVLPLCLSSCRLLKDIERRCIPEKYILIDLLKNFIDQTQVSYNY